MPPQPADAGTLARIAAQRFGTLSPAELKLVMSAPAKELKWLGPADGSRNPDNNAAKGAAWGPDRAVRAEIIRWLASDPEAVALVHPSGLGIAGARIKGLLDLTYSKVDKPITIMNCYMPDGIDLSSANVGDFAIRRASVGTISGNGATFRNDVTIGDGHYGTAAFFRAHINGNIDFTGAHFVSTERDAIRLIEAVVGGDAIFQNGFSADGMVDARLAKIGHDLSFHGAEFTGSDDTGLDAERAEIDGTLYWADVKHTKQTVLDLENARVGAIWDDEASWPAPGNLTLSGFVYGEIAGGPDDAPGRLRWLALQPPGYTPQTYRQVAKVLADTGREEGAADVLIAQQGVRRRFGHLSALESAWNVMLEATIGFGFRPLRALWWIGAFVGFGTVVFEWGYRAGIIAPTKRNAYAEFAISGEPSPHYPDFNPFVYSLENFLPVVVLHQDEYWRPNTRLIPPAKGGHRAKYGPNSIQARLLHWYLWVHILAGWTITPLLFVGLSGLVHPG